jgi:ribosomal protein S18 acetylase RimI-like enzyme
MQGLAQEVWRLAPAPVGPDGTVAQMAWGQGQRAGEPERPHRLWREGGRVVAWGVIFPSELVRITEGHMAMREAMLAWQTHPDRLELLDEVLAWFADEVGDAKKLTLVAQGYAAARARIEAAGYAPDADGEFSLMHRRDLAEIEEPSLPPGFAVRTMAEIDDVPRRVEVHRAAWEPSRLTDEKYRAVMTTWPYRADLDFVVEAPDGQLVSCAIAWYDEANRTGEFEPVGTRPAFRSRGLARAMLLSGMRRLREAGATHAAIGARGDDGYAVPRRVYQSIGFRELSRDMPYVRA